MEEAHVWSGRNPKEPAPIHQMKARKLVFIICEGSTQATEATITLDMSVDAVVSGLKKTWKLKKYYYAESKEGKEQRNQVPRKISIGEKGLTEHLLSTRMHSMQQSK